MIFLLLFRDLNSSRNPAVRCDVNSRIKVDFNLYRSVKYWICIYFFPKWLSKYLVNRIDCEWRRIVRFILYIQANLQIIMRDNYTHTRTKRESHTKTSVRIFRLIVYWCGVLSFKANYIEHILLFWQWVAVMQITWLCIPNSIPILVAALSFELFGVCLRALAPSIDNAMVSIWFVNVFWLFSYCMSSLFGQHVIKIIGWMEWTRKQTAARGTMHE